MTKKEKALTTIGEGQNSVIKDNAKSGTSQLIEMSKLLTRALEKTASLENRVEENTKDITYIKEEAPIDRTTAYYLEKARKKVVWDCLGGKGAPAYKTMSRDVFSEAMRDFKDAFRVSSYLDTPKKAAQQAMRFWQIWQPCAVTRLRIAELNGDERQLKLLEK